MQVRRVFSAVIVVAVLGLISTICHAQIVQAFNGISEANGAIPCANPDGADGCFNVPDGTVVVQPHHFIAPAQPEIYYAVVQTGAWSGSVDVTFQVTEANVVVQTIKAPGAVVLANAMTLVTLAAAIPDNDGYVGPAQLVASTIATPDGGGAPVLLGSRAALEIVSPKSRPETTPPQVGILQVITGVGVESGTCVTEGTASNCFKIPQGALAFQPYHVIVPGPQQFRYGYYGAYQTTNWRGPVGTSYGVREDQSIVQTSGGVGVVVPLAVFLVGGSAELPINGYVGPATLGTMTMATPQGRGHQRTIYSSAPLEVLPFP